MLDMFNNKGDKVELLESKDIDLSNTIYFKLHNGLTVIGGKNKLQQGYAQEVYFRGIVFKELPIVIALPIGEETAKMTNVYENRCYFTTNKQLELNWLAIGFV